MITAPARSARPRIGPLTRLMLVLGTLVAIIGLPAAAEAAIAPSQGGTPATVTPAAVSSATVSSATVSRAGLPAAGSLSAQAQAAALAQTARGVQAAGDVQAVDSAQAVGSAQAAGGLPAGAATAGLPSLPAAPSGGVCAVPGIGDIGELFHFCSAGSGLVGALDNICKPSVPTPEPATGGIDSLIRPPAEASTQPAPSGPPPLVTSATAAPRSKSATLYDSYGMAGQSWAAYDLQCSDMASLIGNNVAGVVFDAAKALDRVTITVYQSAAGEGILAWLTGSVDKLITSLGNAIYFPYLAPVVILGAVWLAWQGLIRKRATRTIEGTLWMVIACAAAIWLIGRPADFTGFGKTVSDGITQTLNVAFAKLPAPEQSSCVPVQRTDPSVGNFSFTSGTSVVDGNANELWTVLVCKPWLDGEFGTTAYAAPGKGHPTVVNAYGRQLLWSQAIAANEKPTPDVIQAKENAFAGLAASLKVQDPAIYPLFTGKQWTTRLEIAFAALFAALIAGVLVLLIAITLIVLKLGFLLLLVAGPFFLIVGTHPGFGRVIALRWAEMLIGVLLKQGAIALVLSVLLYAYSLIMGTSDAVLPWALKILMISLVTVAVFIYRRPFTHLFSAVGYGMVGSTERAETSFARAGSTAARNTLDAASVGIPGFAAYRAARWARRNPAQAASLAAQVSTAGSASALAGAAAAGTAGTGEPGHAEVDGVAADGEAGQTGGRASARGRARATEGAGTGTGTGSGRTPPPLDLPPREADEAPRPLSGWARSGAAGAGRGRPAPSAPDSYRAPAQNGSPAGNGGYRAPAANGNGAPRQAAGPAGGGPAPAPRPSSWQGSAPRRSGGPPPPRPTAPRSPSAAPPAGTGAAGNGAPASGGNGATAGGGYGAGNGGQAPAGPFWLRPLRRKK